MTASSLQTALRAGADGLYAIEAATGLIIAHASWLARNDFALFIHHGAETAVIDWKAAISALDAGELPSSGLLTELPDVAAAQEASRPCGRSSRCPKHPDCQAVAAISPA